MTLGKEPVLIIGTILAVLNAVQQLAITMPDWLHTVILVVTTILGVVIARSQVTPVASSSA